MDKFINDAKVVLPRKLIYCDVGARWGIGEPWNKIKSIIESICFEPDKDEYELLNKKKSVNEKIYQCALYKNQGSVEFNLTKSRGCSSIYKPSAKKIKRYPDAGRFVIDKIINVETSTLDDLYKQKKLNNMDFIKIDIQGAELDVLIGGEKFIKDNVVGVEVEIEFIQLYENQPLFSDVDSFIRNSFGLELQDLRKSYWKYSDGIHVGATKGQLVFGDALYLRSPYEIVEWCSMFSKDKAADKIIMACFSGIVYGYLDYALCILNREGVEDFIDKKKIELLKNIIVNYGKVLKYSGFGARKLSLLFNWLYRIFQPSYEGWASVGHHLGSRKRHNVFC